MLELICNTLRNIGLGIFVNGAFALQFGESPQSQAILAIIEGVSTMLLAGYAELKTKKELK